MGEDRGGCLRLDDGASKKTTSTYDVLLEQLTDNVTNVCHIHLLYHYSAVMCKALKLLKCH